MTFIAGPYTATLNAALGGAGALSLGTVEDGFELEEIHYYEPVRGDNMGDSVQDMVYRGKDVFLSGVFIEADLFGILRGINPHVNVSAISASGAYGQVGGLGTNFGGILNLAAIAGTTAATSAGSPATFQANKAILAPNQSIRRLLASRLRKVPMRFQLLPYVSSGTTYNYVMA